MTRDDKPEFTEISEGLNDTDEIPTDGEQRATGANGPRVSSVQPSTHNVESQVSHSLVDHASQPVEAGKTDTPKKPTC
ncbi:MAG TPA: hypothetical protein VEX37_08030 [Thermomicrobiales bacterium]|nr:hypothetical protein [Thermomicrobiales bacterium]